MNKPQRVIILIGVGLVLLAGLFPPWSWVIVVGGGFRNFKHGYVLIMRPPISNEVHIDTTRLLVEWATIILVAGGLVLALHPRKG